MNLSVGDCGTCLVGGGVGVRATPCMCLACEVGMIALSVSKLNRESDAWSRSVARGVVGERARRRVRSESAARKIDEGKEA